VGAYFIAASCTLGSTRPPNKFGGSGGGILDHKTTFTRIDVGHFSGIFYASA